MNDADIFKVAMVGAQKFLDGESTWQEFTENIAWLSLQSQGIVWPSIEQVEDRAAELNTAAGFIRSIPAPEDE